MSLNDIVPEDCTFQENCTHLHTLPLLPRSPRLTPSLRKTTLTHLSKYVTRNAALVLKPANYGWAWHTHECTYCVQHNAISHHVPSIYEDTLSQHCTHLNSTQYSPPNMASPTPPQTQVLLIGLGELGHALYTQISRLSNTFVTLGIRSPAKYTHLASPTTSLLELDVTSSSSDLVPVFSRFDIVISATGYGESAHRLPKLAREMLTAGRLRKQQGKGEMWFFPWQWGCDFDVTGDVGGLMPLFGVQKQIRDLLRNEAEEAGVKWTIVSTGLFMSFLFEPFWGIVDRSREAEEGEITVRCLDRWEHGVTVTDVSDTGRVLVRILKGDVDAANKVLHIAGDTVTYGELANIMERVSGRTLRREAWSVEQLQAELQRDPEDLVKKYRVAFAGEGVYWPVERTVNHRLEMEMNGVETYARKLLGTEK